jgi:hypothetical protein
MGFKSHLKAVSSTAFRTLINSTCNECGRTVQLNLRTDGLLSWAKGEFVQKALPELTDDEREALITGICPPCWDAMWSVNDDGDRHGEEGAADFPDPPLTQNGAHA